MKKILVLLLAVTLLCGCGKKEHPIVSMEIENYGVIQLELYPEYAPNTVANFVYLVEHHFYDGLTFHRMQKNFVLQGGDPNGNGSGDPGYSIKGEFKLNDYSKNTLSHTKGVISMARSDDYDRAGSQFFIVLSDQAVSSLDGRYAGFGKVIEGMDIIEKIEEEAKVSDSSMGILEENIKITKVTVDTKGETYKVKRIFASQS